MIEKITIKECATFDEIWVEINNLKKVNFFYGANWTWKTTISDFIYGKEASKYKDCESIWLNDNKLETLVYNKTFKKDNFGKWKLAWVFTLWNATKEDIENIKKKQEKLKTLKDWLIEKNNTLEKQKETKDTLINDFKEKAWNEIYKKYEVNFKDWFTGYMQKEKFKTKLLYEFDNNKWVKQEFDDLKKKAKIIFWEQPKELEKLSKIDFEKLIKIEENWLWNKKIIWKNDVEINKLIQKLNINDWVFQWKQYIQEDSFTCPFCQNDTINTNFKNQLEQYFDETFTKDTNKIKELEKEYIELASNLVFQLQDIEKTEKGNISSKLNIELFSSYLKTLISLLWENKLLLNNKLKEFSRSIELKSIKNQLDEIEKTLEDWNKKIIEHNKIVDNYKSEFDSLVDNIWKYIINENKTIIEVFNKINNWLQKGINNLEKEVFDIWKNINILDTEIKTLNKNVTSVQPAIDEINNMLKNYWFLNFKIVPSKEEKNFYQIQRDDWSIAEDTLSEWEVSFITFLYFLQIVNWALNKEEIWKERILVIDDPISSLDSNILFIVSVLVKEIIENIKQWKWNIKQIIILTHNVYFHKEVSFMKWNSNEDKDVHYWILRKNNKISNIQSFEKDNPIHTSYWLLWKELKENNSNIVIQNIMRRIIEHYFKNLWWYKDDDIIWMFDDYEEKIICKTLFSWVNDGSHSIWDDLFIENDNNEKYHNVFEEIFNKTKHIEHYNMMIWEKI